MSGKVDPVVPEMVNQLCLEVIGFDKTVAMAAEASELSGVRATVDRPGHGAQPGAGVPAFPGGRHAGSGHRAHEINRPDDSETDADRWQD